MMFSLQGKVAVITGAGSGIGKATAQRFVKAGAKVVIGDMSDASDFANSIGALYVHADVTVESDVAILLGKALDEWGSLDILVNNAGTFSNYKKIADTTEEDLQFCFDVNTKGVAFGLKHASTLMSDGGSIVNTASFAARSGVVDLGAYVTSKYAVVGLTQTAALELAPRRIRVNCICPTTVNTPMAYEDDGEDLIAWERNWVPLRRVCEPEEAAALIHFLASDDCGFINGQAINLCGGASAGLSEHALGKLAAS